MQHKELRPVRDPLEQFLVLNYDEGPGLAVYGARGERRGFDKNPDRLLADGIVEVVTHGPTAANRV